MSAAGDTGWREAGLLAGEGETVHVRLKPFRHAFRYKLPMVLATLRTAERARGRCLGFGLDRWAPLSWRRKDLGDKHASAEPGALAHWAEARFTEAGVDLEGGDIAVLSQPAAWGQVFNPISLYFGYGPGGDLRGVIYAVNNTFGDRHAYAAAVPAQAHGALAQTADKTFHVSPFFDVSGRYRFDLTPPDGRSLALRIQKYDAAGALDHIATLRVALAPLGRFWALRQLLSRPHLSWRTLGLIHWEALHLWRKGARYHRRPTPPAEAASPAINIAQTPQKHLGLLETETSNVTFRSQ